MWTYKVDAGQMLNPQGISMGTWFYSGHGEGVNNPQYEQIQNVGPIPRGEYIIGDFFNDPEKGPLVCHLEPTSGTDTFLRSGFMIHGDNRQMNRSASHGCIISPHTARFVISLSNDKLLKVV